MRPQISVSSNEAQLSDKPAEKTRRRSNAGRKYAYVPRDPAATKKRILDAAVVEFAARGFAGARVETIVKAANSNMRLLYHYYTDKEQLYVAVIEKVYQDVRLNEQNLQIESDEPARGLERLVDFTFDHFRDHPDLISIVMNENILHAAYLKKSDLVPTMTQKLSSSVRVLVEKGHDSGVFARKPDPIHLWLTIFSLCWVHLANRYTMSWTLQFDLADAEWLESRKRHVREVVMSYLVGTGQPDLLGRR